MPLKPSFEILRATLQNIILQYRDCTCTPKSGCSWADAQDILDHLNKVGETEKLQGIFQNPTKERKATASEIMRNSIKFEHEKMSKMRPAAKEERIHKTLEYSQKEIDKRMPKSKMKKAKKKPYPRLSCRECAVAAGWKPKPDSIHIASYYSDICDVCGEQKTVTEVRDFGHIFAKTGKYK